MDLPTPSSRIYSPVTSHPIIDLQNIVLERNNVYILRGVSWSIDPGQHWALLGANGSGKTSLLKVIAGYEWVTRGRVEVLGEHFGETNIRALRRLIGWVSSSLTHRFPPDDLAFMIAVSGFDASVGLWREFSDEEIYVAYRALEFIGAERIAEQPWRVLSQGERQRVLIARAIVSQPRLLILDEPCAGLDPVAREEFLDDIEGFAAREDAPTILLVTHHIEEIRPCFTHALVVKDGLAIARGRTGEVVTSAVLSDAFGHTCEVTRVGEGFTLHVPR